MKKTAGSVQTETDPANRTFPSRAVGNVAAGLLIAIFGTACTPGQDPQARPTATFGSGNGDPGDDENVISCGEITHLRVDPGLKRVLVIEGTEFTVGMTLNRETLSVDQGNDGVPEATLSDHAETSLQFGPPKADVLDLAFNYFSDPARAYGYVSLSRSCRLQS